MPFLLNSNASYVLWSSLYQIVVADFCSPIQNSQALFFFLFITPGEFGTEIPYAVCAEL